MSYSKYISTRSMHKELAIDLISYCLLEGPSLARVSMRIRSGLYHHSPRSIR